jgi:hypothetical protein
MKLAFTRRKSRYSPLALDACFLTLPEFSPVTAAFYAAQSLAERPDYLTQYPLTIADYQEYGSSAWRKRFAAE